MSRASRLVVLLSAIGAAVLQAEFAARAWPALPALTAALFLLGFALAVRHPGPTAGTVLACGYLLPALLVLSTGGFWFTFWVLWTGALLGVISASAVRDWAIPHPWNTPLVTWALLVAFSWPIVVLREFDFTFATLADPRVSNTGVGVPPAVAVSGIIDAALTQMVGILWFDWLYSTFREPTAHAFRRSVMLPLAVSAGVLCVVALYQGLFDIGFLNQTVFGALNRASGTLLDGNAAGMVAAIWTGGFIALWSSAGHRKPSVFIWGATLTAALGVWMTGSRTALLAATVALAFVGGLELRRARHRGRLVAIAAASLFIVVLATRLTPRVVGPMARLTERLPPLTWKNAGNLVSELWNRAPYGPAAAEMLRDVPWVGVGVGSFNLLSVDYASLFRVKATFDNAQNWYRHELTELGLLGSIGWMVWVALFVTTLVRTSGEGENRLSSVAIKGSIVGLGAASMLGVPAQNPAVALTFWTFAFWYLILVPRRANSAASPILSRRDSLRWALVIAIVAAYSLGTYAAGRGVLRPANRAARVGWDYEYGFYDAERAADGLTYRWAGNQAVVVLPAPKPWLHLIASVNHFDIATNPVRAKIWCGGRLVVDTILRTTTPLTRYVHVPEEQPGVVLETWVSRVVHPRDLGIADDRELGLFVHWDFVDAPPPGATTADVTPR